MINSGSVYIWAVNKYLKLDHVNKQVFKTKFCTRAVAKIFPSGHWEFKKVKDPKNHLV